MTELLNSQEAAARLAIHERTLRHWAAMGRVTRHRGTDGRAYYEPAELDRAAAADPLPVPERIRRESDLARALMEKLLAAERDRRADEEAKRRRAERATSDLARRLRAAEDQVSFLRERVVAAERSAEQHRVLLQHAQGEIHMLNERLAVRPALPPALPLAPAAAPARRRWWAFWEKEE